MVVNGLDELSPEEMVPEIVPDVGSILRPPGSPVALNVKLAPVVLLAVLERLTESPSRSVWFPGLASPIGPTFTEKVTVDDWPPLFVAFTTTLAVPCPVPVGCSCSCP